MSKRRTEEGVEERGGGLEEVRGRGKRRKERGKDVLRRKRDV